MCNMTLKKDGTKAQLFPISFFFFFSLHKNTKQINTEEIKKIPAHLSHSTPSSFLILFYHSFFTYDLSSVTIHILNLSKKFLLLSSINLNLGTPFTYCITTSLISVHQLKPLFTSGSQPLLPQKLKTSNKNLLTTFCKSSSYNL